MREKLRAFGAWLYNWITVLTGVLMGGLSVAFWIYDTFTASADLSLILSPDRAGKVTMIVAALKGMHAVYSAWKARDAVAS